MAKAKAKKPTKIKQVKSVYLIAEDTMREMITMLHAMRCDLAGFGRVIDLREKMAEQSVTIRRLLEEKRILGDELEKAKAGWFSPRNMPRFAEHGIPGIRVCPTCGIVGCTVHSNSAAAVVAAADKFVRGES